MAEQQVVARQQLQEWFKSGEYPTESQFYAWMNSYFHLEDEIDQKNITGLTDALDSKASIETTNALQESIDTINDHRQDLIYSTAEEEDYPSVAAVKAYVDYRTPFYVNKYGIDAYQKFYIGSATSWTSPEDVVIVPLLDDDGELKECSSLKGLVSFWLCDIFDEDDNRLELTDIQYKKIVLEYYLNGVVRHCKLAFRNGQLYGELCYVKDVYGKQVLVQFDPYYTANCTVINGIASDPLVSEPLPVPETQVTLNTDNTTYTVTTETASVVGVIAYVADCEIVLPDMEADQSVTFIIKDSSKSIIIEEVEYLAGDTVFCVYDSEEELWAVNNTKAPEIDDYANVEVKHVILDGWTEKTTASRGKKIQGTSDYEVGDLVLIANYLYCSSTTASSQSAEQGLYYISEMDSSYKVWLKLVVSADSLNIVKSSFTNPGVWLNTYVGDDVRSVNFKQIESYDDITVKYVILSGNTYETDEDRGKKINKAFEDVVKGDKVAILNEMPCSSSDVPEQKAEAGLYYIDDTDSSGNMWLIQICDATAMRKVTSSSFNEGVYYNTYGGTDNSLVNFEQIDGKEDVANKSTDGTLADDSDTLYPSQKAVKTYVDTSVASVASEVAVTREYITTVGKSGSLNVGTSYSKIELSVKSFEDGTEMTNSTIFSFDNYQVVFAEAGNYKATVTFPFWGTEGEESGITACLRKKNQTKYSDYRVEIEATEYVKDAWGATICFDIPFQIASDEILTATEASLIQIAVKSTQSIDLTIGTPIVTIEKTN